MGLFKKSYRYVKYDEKISKEINKISDQKRLMEIAQEATDIKIVDEALNRITDDNFLYEIVNSKHTNHISTQTHALARIRDEKIINKMINELPPTHRYLQIIYDNIKNPPFELSIQMGTKKAEENLIKDLNQMKYPEDKEKIKQVIKTIARKLDNDNPLLDKEVCPNCGAIESMYLFDEYRRSIDMNVRGYRCDKCKHEFIGENGLGELMYHSITLRKFIEK